MTTYKIFKISCLSRKFKLSLYAVLILVSLLTSLLFIYGFCNNDNTENISLSVENKISETNYLRNSTGKLKSIDKEFKINYNTASQQKNVDLAQAKINREAQIKANMYYIPDLPLSRSLQEYTFNLCKDNNISYELILGLMYYESKFDPYVVSYNTNGSYDSGIMQINSCNKEYLRKTYGITNLIDPYENIFAGISMISDDILKYGENDALMVYNMGLGGYYNAVGRGIYSTTYSNEVLSKKQEIENMEKVI
ncbi:MAG: transglycosylase SLT domain-containing protein [Clostridia bacterium]|nr:transglycosylase SLT domain-containing protein [Clostridia bacterium]